MKNIYLSLTILLVCSVLTSCRTSQKLTLRGEPGSEIFTPTMEKVGNIGSNGLGRIKLDIDCHIPFLISKQVGTQTFIPFALDYKKTNYQGRFLLGVFTLYIPCIGMPSTNSDQSHNYKYLPTQTTNDDFRFTPFVDQGIEKSCSASPTEDRKSVKVSSSSIPQSSSVAKRSLNDFAKVVSGTYTGTGSLVRHGNVIEKYSTMKVVITRIDKNNVRVNVVESGESFFASESQYAITKQADEYSLAMVGNASSTILINEVGELSYTHTQVIIDGEEYTLRFSGTK